MTIMERVHTNGQRGRIVAALTQFTFKDTNTTIGIRKVGPSTQQSIAQAIRRDMPEPPIPITETELGPEANPADPAYLAAKAEWDQQTRAELTRRIMLIAALEAEVTIDDQYHADVARRRHSLRAALTPYQDDPELTQEENDRVLYVLHVAAGSPQDLGEFGVAVLRRSAPTEEAVQTHVATFQRDL